MVSTPFALFSVLLFLISFTTQLLCKKGPVQELELAAFKKYESWEMKGIQRSENSVLPSQADIRDRHKSFKSPFFSVVLFFGLGHLVGVTFAATGNGTTLHSHPVFSTVLAIGEGLDWSRRAH
ncbi:hypothetical protein C8J56DRAFT_1028976 [Mycena floridula]|nr:hypothetical protein C8J56DRAFT_1028976 [Mycena floridula]